MQLLGSVSLPRRAASHSDICCLSVCLRSPVPPRLRGSLPSLSLLGGGYQSERGKENSCGNESAACWHWCLLYPAHPGLHPGLVEIDCPEKHSHTNKPGDR